MKQTKINKSDKVIPKEITVNEVISYIWRTDNYGVAEFDFCPVFKNGYMERLYIYRRQQMDNATPNSTLAYFIDIKKTKLKITSFMIESWIHKTNPPRIWRNMWCPIHKAVLFEVYVPKDTNQIKFEFHFGDSLSIRFEQNGG